MKSKRVTSTISLVLASAWLAACAASAPVQEISDARQAIAAAEEADAEQFAPQTLSEAREFLLQAEALIREGSYNAARGDAVLETLERGGSEVTRVELPGTGHAMLNERPNEVLETLAGALEEARPG